MASGYVLLFQQHEGQSAMLQARTSRPTDSSPRCFSILQTTLQIMRLPVAAVMRLATTARPRDVDRAPQRKGSHRWYRHTNSLIVARWAAVAGVGLRVRSR